MTECTHGSFVDGFAGFLLLSLSKLHGAVEYDQFLSLLDSPVVVSSAVLVPMQRHQNPRTTCT